MNAAKPYPVEVSEYLETKQVSERLKKSLEKIIRLSLDFEISNLLKKEVSDSIIVINIKDINFAEVMSILSKVSVGVSSVLYKTKDKASITEISDHYSELSNMADEIINYVNKTYYEVAIDILKKKDYDIVLEANDFYYKEISYIERSYNFSSKGKVLVARKSR